MPGNANVLLTLTMTTMGVATAWFCLAAHMVVEGKDTLACLPGPVHVVLAMG